MLILPSVVVFIVGCALAARLAKVAGQKSEVEVLRFVLASVGVFLGVFLAFQFGELQRNTQEKEYIKRLLGASLLELENLRTHMENIPDDILKIQKSQPLLTPKDFMSSNPLRLPPVITESLKDVDFLRLLSEPGITNIFTSRDNIEKILSMLNKADLSLNKMREGLEFATSTLEDLIRFLNFEYRYQNKQINENTLRSFHDRYISERNEKSKDGS